VTRAALYVRVSTKEQAAENQERELRAWAERSGYEVARVYADVISGARGDRAALAAVLAGAHRREFDALLIWSLDRSTREGIAPMLAYLQQLHAVGVRVVSLNEAWVDSASPTWDLLVAIFGWVSRSGSGSASGSAPAKPGLGRRASGSAGSLGSWISRNSDAGGRRARAGAGSPGP
jgi:DNA invertase Pin-like site-specific DNA recombinase